MNTQTKQLDHEACRIIEEMGGNGAVSNLTDLTTGAVSQWRYNGIPKPWMKLFRAVRPDVFKKRKAA